MQQNKYTFNVVLFFFLENQIYFREKAIRSRAATALLHHPTNVNVLSCEHGHCPIIGLNRASCLFSVSRSASLILAFLLNTAVSSVGSMPPFHNVLIVANSSW